MMPPSEIVAILSAIGVAIGVGGILEKMRARWKGPAHEVAELKKKIGELETTAAESTKERDDKLGEALREINQKLDELREHKTETKDHGHRLLALEQRSERIRTRLTKIETELELRTDLTPVHGIPIAGPGRQPSQSSRPIRPTPPPTPIVRDPRDEDPDDHSPDEDGEDEG